MTHHTTTYNNSTNQSLPLAFANGRKAEVRRVFRRVFFLFIIMVMGVGSAWGQDPVFSQWGGTVPGIPANTNKTTVNNAGIEGDGTSDSPYLIKNADDFAFFWAASYNGKITSSTQYWRLEANIDLNNKSWATHIAANGTFKGKFDGQNHIISNMKLEPTTADKNYGLFCVVEGQAVDNRAEIKNLTIDNATITPSAALGKTTSVGIVVGKSNKNADIVNVKVTNSNITYAKNISDANYVGGIVGQTASDTKLTDCSVSTLGITTSGTTTNAYFGGLIGYIGSKTDVTNCSTTAVTITYNAIANASRISGLIGYAKGATDNPIIVNKCTVSNTNINLKAGINNGSYIGALVGQTADYTLIGDGTETNKNTVTSPNINIGGDIKAASYIGGATGYMAGGSAILVSTINGLTVTSPSVTINKVAVANCYIGAAFGRLNTFFSVDDVNVSNPTLTYNNTDNQNFTLYLGTFAGGFAGNTTKEVSVTNIKVTGNSQLTLGTEAKKTTTEIKAVRAGIVGYAEKNVRFEDWTVEKTKVQVYGKLTTAASYIGAFTGQFKGEAGAPITAKNININEDNAESGSTLDVTGVVTAACYLGGFAGQVTTNCQLEECTVKKPKVTLYDFNTETSFVGGVIGDFSGAAGNTSTLKGLHVTSPSVAVETVSVTTANKEFYGGSVFGRINNYTTVTSVDVSSPTFTCNATTNNKAIYLGSFAGRIVGHANQETLVTNVTATGTAQLTIGTDTNKGTNVIYSVNAGFVGRFNTNVRMEAWDIANTSLQINGSLKTGASYLGGLAGYMESATSAPLTLKNVKVTGNSTINVTGNIEIGSYLGGFAGQIYQGNVTYSNINIDGAGVNGTSTVYVGGNVTTASYAGGFVGRLLGKNAAGNSVQADNVKVGTTSLTINGQTTAASYYGGLAGQVTTACTLNDWSTTTGANLTFNNSITALSFIGGAIGSLDGTAGYPSSATGFDVKGVDINLNCDITTKGIYVGGIVGQLNAVAQTNKIEKSSVSGKIHTTGSHTFTPSNITYAFGGVVGYMPQGTTTFSEVNNCVSEVDFDLSGLKSSSISGSNHNLYSGLVVGGVIGRINTPSRLPEALYYSGKIYAPFAAVAPIVGVFVTDASKAAYLYDDYTGENLKTTVISADEWAKADDWYFNGYKLGLSTDVTTQTARTKNYSDTPTTIDGISYLTIGENTLKNFNAIGGGTKKSKTILIYDTNNKDQDKGIYPQWATNSATYPAYYMYYMQGVNRGNFVADDQAATIKGKVLSGAFALLTLTDANADLTKAANRGFISHALTAKTSGTGYIYKWYVDGVEQTETSANFAVTPTMKGNTIAVEAIKGGKALKRVECKVYPVFRVGDASAATGTKTNPYLIASADELQLLSYLSTLPLNTPWEKMYTSDGHYNKAYYELDGDIDLSGVADFTPISFATGYKANGAMSLGYVFNGVFDGNQHKISGLKEEWYGGAIKDNGSFMGWGLFSIVGSPMPTVKVGDSGASPTAIRNLIIDGATLTHRTSNTTFNFDNTAGASNSDHVCIGVLSGLVLNNTKIDNIEIRNSKITDEGSSDYSLATRGLYVGGAVGSIQNAFNEEANAPVNTKMQHIAAQVDITLEHPTFADATVTGQLGMFNIGGIIGRYCSTSALQDQAQVSMPAFTLYSGSVTTSKAWISPVLGALRYATQQSVTWANYSKIWEGNNNTAATQITITNAQYYNFRINGELITELYPTGSCDMGTRHIAGHADGTDALETYFPNKYQGINYNARFIDSEGTTMRYLNEGVTDGVYWTWENGFPHMTDQPYKGAHLVVASSNLTANMENGTASAYRWEVSTDGETWIEVDGASLQNYKPSPSSTDTRLFVAIITADGVEYRTQAEIILPQNDLFSPYVTTVGNSTDGYDLTLNWNGEEPSGDFTVSYQWYKNDRTTVLEGQTSKTLHLSQSELDASDGIVWCAVTINENGKLLTTIYAVGGDVVVVFVDGTNGKDNSAGSRERGWTPETAVKTIDNANLLLKPVVEGGSMDKNYVVIIGTLNKDCFNSKGSNPATLTGKWGGTNYKGLITLGNNNDDNLNEGDDPTKTGAHNYVLADTKFEYLTFKSTGDGTGAGTQVNLHCHGKDVWFGKGLVLSNFGRSPENHTNIYNEEIPNFSVILTATNISHPNEEYWTRTKPQVLTIESGHYARILGGRFTNKFFAANTNTTHTIQATAKHPSWAIINIDIDPDNRMTSVEGKKYACDVNLVCAGLTDGTIYEDLEINVHGGIVNTIVGANQGNAVVNGSKSLTPVGGKNGAFGEWPNSSFLGRTIINVEQDEKLKPIMIRNMYGGGLGRSVSSNTGIIVDMYEYGRTVVNMKSGTVLGNIYGGGVGGVLGANPWDPRIPYASEVENDATNVIQNGVQYGGKPAGSPWAKVTLHNRNADGTYSTEEMDLSQSSTTINIYGGTIGGGINGGPIEGNIYGGGDGEVNGMDNTICLQGVGSVFGTSNINIYGGNILGSVYGGSKGSKKYYNLQNSYGQTITHIAEMNGEVNINITGTDAKYPTIGGSIYGAGLGIVSTATEEYPRIATAGNADLGDKYKTDINITIEMPETVEFPNDIYGGGALGKVDGTTNIILKRGMFTGSIYGGGFGEKEHLDKAMVTGTTNIYTGAVNPDDPEDPNRSLRVNVKPSETDDTKVPTIYGGGNMAQVTGNTYINLYHGNITADVFGGGKGLTQSLSGTFSTYGQVNGNTRVLYNNTTKDNKLTGNIYGGGALGAVVGTGTGQDKGTTVVIKAGEVDGDVFGGGKGEEGSEKAKVTGNTNVIVDSGW